jgi:hypothetical protein
LRYKRVTGDGEKKLRERRFKVRGKTFFLFDRLHELNYQTRASSWSVPRGGVNPVAENSNA